MQKGRESTFLTSLPNNFKVACHGLHFEKQAIVELKYGSILDSFGGEKSRIITESLSSYREGRNGASKTGKQFRIQNVEIIKMTNFTCFISLPHTYKWRPMSKFQEADFSGSDTIPHTIPFISHLKAGTSFKCQTICYPNIKLCQQNPIIYNGSLN